MKRTIKNAQEHTLVLRATTATTHKIHNVYPKATQMLITLFHPD